MRMPLPGFGGRPMQPPMRPQVQQPKVQPRAGGRPVMQTFPSRPMTQPAVGTPFNKPTGPQVQPPMGGFGGPMQPQVQPPMGGFGGPMQPQVQPPMGGFGPGINNFGAAPGGSFGQPQQPGTGQSALGGQQDSPFNLMQRFQQMQQIQQMMPQGGQQPGQPMGIAGGIGMPPQPMGGGDPMQPRISGGPVSDPMQDQYQAFMNQTQGRPDNAPMQPGQPMGIAGGGTGMPPIGQPMDRRKQIMTQPPAPNPYAKPIGQEDPRMQAMRNMQQMNLGG